MRQITILLVIFVIGQEIVQEISGCQSVDNYFNRRYFSLNDTQVSYDQLVQDGSANCERRQLPLREYKQSDVIRCFDLFSTKRNGRRMHIAFVGDSIVRQYFLSFLRLIPDYDRKVKSLSTFAAEYHFHEDRNVTSELLGNLLVSFYWRNLIKKDLLVDFKRWASTTDDSKAPDYIVLGVTSHHVDYNNVTNTLEMYENLLEHKLLPLINQSLATHPNQEIIWLRQSSTTDYIGPSGDRLKHGIDSEKIFKYNEAVRRILKDTRVLMWDSVNVFTEEYLRSCGLNRVLLRHDPYKYVNCNDFIHPGFRAIAIGSQLFINHICSPLMHDDDYLSKRKH